MSSRKLLAERLPPHLLSEMHEHPAGPSWPFAIIPAVIEACRAAELVSLGGDLQVRDAHGVWESPHVGVTVFAHELSDRPVDQAAVVALEKIAALDAGLLLTEVAAGRPGGLNGITFSDLYFSWTVEAA